MSLVIHIPFRKDHSLLWAWHDAGYRFKKEVTMADIEEIIETLERKGFPEINDKPKMGFDRLANEYESGS